MHAEGFSDYFFILEAQRRNNIMDLSGGFNRSDRIIFMAVVNAENGHDSVSDKLFDEAFVLGTTLDISPKIFPMISLTSSVQAFSVMAV